MSTPYESATLLIRLYELRREPTMREARAWYVSKFNPTSADDIVATLRGPDSAQFRMVTSYWDMAASFVASGIINAELFYRSNNTELLYVWERIRRMVPEMRQVGKNPLSYRNLEEVASGFIKFYAEHAPGYYENLVSMVEKTAAPAK